METKKWRGSKPETCDLCHKPFEAVFIDGKTKQGPWGLLCAMCHYKHGVGLGEGRGQMYNTKTREKING